MSKSKSPVMAFLLDYLRRKPNAPFSEVVAAGKKHKLRVIPVVYGRAKKLLGTAKPAIAKPTSPAPKPKKAAASKKTPSPPLPAAMTPPAHAEVHLPLERAVRAARVVDAWVRATNVSLSLPNALDLCVRIGVAFGNE